MPPRPSSLTNRRSPKVMPASALGTWLLTAGCEIVGAVTSAEPSVEAAAAGVGFAGGGDCDIQAPLPEARHRLRLIIDTRKGRASQETSRETGGIVRGWPSCRGRRWRGHSLPYGIGAN